MHACPTPATCTPSPPTSPRSSDLALGHSVVADRFTGTAILSRDAARDLGTLGYVARASGLPVDARHQHPFHDGGDAFTPATRDTGDVLARFLVRADEIAASAALITALTSTVTAGTTRTEPPTGTTARAASGVGIVEGWRGTITHRVELAPDHTLTRAKIVDPSFFNWPALPVALSGHHRPRLPPRQQKLQPLLRRQRPIGITAAADRGASHAASARRSRCGTPVEKAE